MAEAFLQTLVQHLSLLIQGEIGLIIGVDEEMKKLSSTLTTIQAVLEDAETKQLESRAIQNWLLKLNDLTYEIDDILDECTTQVSKLKRQSNKFSRYSLTKILFRRKIGTRMKEVTAKLDAVAAERAKFHLRVMDFLERPIDVGAIRETGSVLNESHRVYGRQKDREKIVDILVNHVSGNEEISILPIIGVGGLGKTTLAQLVLKDQRVIDHFDTKLWVCVSDSFDLKALLKAVIESGTRNVASELVHLDTLQHQLYELLNEKRYLLVLDDVWNEDQEKWSELRNVLACGSNGSSIIITTRVKKVADIMGTLPAHYLKGLSEGHCWLLMKDRAFGQGEEEYPNLEAIGKEIVKKCAGVPLAAKALGGLLRFKRTEKEWNYVKESEIWELPQEETLILPALKLSYHHLPLALRQCFAYCAAFPKDCLIQKEELIFMWMAHGYISPKGVLEVEDVGEEICNELVLRSLLKYVPDTDNTTLIMHDLVHDLAQSIMENKVPGTQDQRNVKSASSNSKIRQVNLRNKCVAFPTSNQFETDMSFVLTNFRRLRVLNASKTGIKDLPCTLGSNLQHLRHLNLSKTGIRTLPESLCSIWNLQVLNLDYCQELVALPKNTRYLINLRHLFLESCISLSEMPSRIKELTCLRTLSLFIVGPKRGNQLEELQWLNLGGKLTVLHLERVRNPMDAKKANFSEKKNLVELRLFWQNDNEPKKGQEDIDTEIDEKVLEALEPHPNLQTLVMSGFRGKRFPAWMSNSALEKVVEIDISDCENCMRLPQLGDLPHLKCLRLNNLALEYIIADDDQIGSVPSARFQSLEAMFLGSLPNLKGLLLNEQVTSEAFTNLQKLYIRDCSSLILPSLSSLKKLESLRCSSSTLSSLSTPDTTLTDLFLEIDNNITTRVPTGTLQNLGNIKGLEIYRAHELCLPDEGLRDMKSLRRLWISNSATLASLPEGWLLHLGALEQLEIDSCPEFVDLPEGIKHLERLERLVLDDLPKMVRLPEALRHLSLSLQFLSLSYLPQLDSLPEWLEDLALLESLSISRCPKIESLPDSIRGMGNLRFLCVYDCPELERRCVRGKGEEWHKIAHIPYLQIGGD